MYKGHPFANKLLEKIEQDKLRTKHLVNIRRARPNTGMPEHSETTLTLNPRKKQMQNQNKYTQIQRENRLLLNKITTIMGKRKGGSEGKGNGSLNYSLRRRQSQTIEVQNAKMLRRLQQKKSDYELHKFKKEWRKTKTVIKNIASQPIVIDEIVGRRKRRNNEYEINELKRIAHTNPEDFQLVKVRLIGGKKFIITLKFSANKFIVIGDLRSEKELKVIEIDKLEALEFIEQNCDGDIHNLFDLVRYEEQQGSLYLVPKGMQITNLRAASEMTGEKALNRRRKPILHKPLESMDMSTLNREDLIF